MTQTWLGTTTRRLFLDRHARFVLSELNPTWSLTETVARIVAIEHETADTKTFTLAPNRRWRGHQAGQYVPVDVTVDGARTRRCYSLSSPPSAARPTITVKRVPGGVVSGWLHDHAEVGDTVVLGEAAGDFVIPAKAPARMLCVAGGSGVTPLLSILEDLVEREALRDVVLVVYARTSFDVIGARRLSALAQAEPGLEFHCVVGAAGRRAFDEADFRELVPDFAERDTWMCGPGGLMARVEALYVDAEAGDRLHVERFVSAAPRLADPALRGGVGTLTLGRAGRALPAEGGVSLLEQLEAAGERPAFGCRLGICKTCRCRKVAGAVQNMVTGEVSTRPDEDIQLCISAPRGDVALNL